MFPIRFLKAPPTTYVLHYNRGRVKREGAGLSFFYWAPWSTIVRVPIASSDAPFVFTQATSDFQTVTVQGQLTYRIADARKASSLLDYSVDADGDRTSDDPAKLVERLVNELSTLTQRVSGRMTLREALARGEGVKDEVLGALVASEIVATLGVEILGLSILAVRATPEMAKALEAEAREALQRGSDEAIYARRNAAVEQERRIKETELNTEIAVEEKKRLIREVQMAADIAVEEQRAALIDRRVANERKDADARAYALEATLAPIRTLDWRTLQMLSANGACPATSIALAFQELAANAQKIGELNVSPDLLRSLLAAK
jgi:hypothetical protein